MLCAICQLPRLSLPKELHTQPHNAQKVSESCIGRGRQELGLLERAGFAATASLNWLRLRMREENEALYRLPFFGSINLYYRRLYVLTFYWCGESEIEIKPLMWEPSHGNFSRISIRLPSDVQGYKWIKQARLAGKTLFETKWWWRDAMNVRTFSLEMIATQERLP